MYICGSLLPNLLSNSPKHIIAGPSKSCSLDSEATQMQRKLKLKMASLLLSPPAPTSERHTTPHPIWPQCLQRAVSVKLYKSFTVGLVVSSYQSHKHIWMCDAPPSSNPHLTRAVWFYLILFVASRGFLADFFRLHAEMDFIYKCKTVFTLKLCAPSCLFLGWPPVQRKKIGSCSVGHTNAKTSVVIRVKNICGLDSYPTASVPFILLMRHVKLLFNQREPNGLSSYQQPTYTGTRDEDERTNDETLKPKSLLTLGPDVGLHKDRTH